jgi:hypothetical protein
MIPIHGSGSHPGSPLQTSQKKNIITGGEFSAILSKNSLMIHSEVD